MKIANKEIKVHAKKTKQNIEFQKNKDSLSSQKSGKSNPTPLFMNKTEISFKNQNLSQGGASLNSYNEIQITGPPGFRPKSGGKLVCGEGRSSQFRASQIRSDNLRILSAQQIEQKQIINPHQPSKVCENFPQIAQIVIQHQDMPKNEQKTRVFVNQIENYEEEEQPKTFFSKVMNEIGIISTKKISQKHSNATLTQEELIALSLNKRSQTESNPADRQPNLVKFEPDLGLPYTSQQNNHFHSVSQQIMQNFGRENFGDAFNKTADLPNFNSSFPQIMENGRNSENDIEGQSTQIIQVSKILEMIKEKDILLQKTPENLHLFKQPFLNQKNSSSSQMQRKWDIEGEIKIKSGLESPLLVDFNIKKKERDLRKKNEKQTEINFATLDPKAVDMIGDSANLKLSSGNQSYNKEGQSNEKQIQEQTKTYKHTHYQNFGQNQKGLMGGLSVCGIVLKPASKTVTYFAQEKGDSKRSEMSSNSRLDTLENQREQKKSKSRQVKLKNRQLQDNAKQKIEQSSNSQLTRITSSIPTNHRVQIKVSNSIVNQDYRYILNEKKSTGGSDASIKDQAYQQTKINATNDKNSIRHQSEMGTKNKKAYEFFRNSLDQSSEISRNFGDIFYPYGGLKPQVKKTLDARNRYKNHASDLNTLQQSINEPKRLNSAEVLQKPFSTVMLNDVDQNFGDKNGIKSLKSFLQLVKQQNGSMNMSGSESALAICLQLQQRGQIPIKAFEDSRIFKKNDWKDIKKNKQQQITPVHHLDSDAASKSLNGFKRKRIFNNSSQVLESAKDVMAKQRPKSTLDTYFDKKTIQYDGQYSNLTLEGQGSIQQEREVLSRGENEPFGFRIRSSKRSFKRPIYLINSLHVEKHTNNLLETQDHGPKTNVSNSDETNIGDYFMKVEQDIQNRKKQYLDELLNEPITQSSPAPVLEQKLEQKMTAKEAQKLISELKSDLDWLDAERKSQYSMAMRAIIRIDTSQPDTERSQMKSSTKSQISKKQSSIASVSQITKGVSQNSNQFNIFVPSKTNDHEVTQAKSQTKLSQILNQESKTVDKEQGDRLGVFNGGTKFKIGGGITLKDLNDPQIKEKIVNSLHYRVSKKMPQNISKEFFPDYIKKEMDDMFKDNNTDRKTIVTDPFFIVQKPSKDRTPQQIKCVATFLQNTFKQFKNMENELVYCIVGKLFPETFMLGTYISDDKMSSSDATIIVLDGAVTVITNDKEYIVQGPQLYWKNCVEEKDGPKPMKLKCLTECKVLFLHQSNFQFAISSSKTETMHQSLILLKRVLALRDWNMLRLMSFSDALNRVTYPAKSTIYNLGDETSNVYFIREGCVKLEVFYAVDYITSVPKINSFHDRRTTCQVIKKTIKHVQVGEIFGLEEIIMSRPIRLIRAKSASCQNLLVYSCSKRLFLQYMQRKDIRKYIEYCKSYTDFDKHGNTLIQAMINMKRNTESLLEASQVSKVQLKNKNFRSQETFYTWLGVQDFGPKAKNKLEIIQKYAEEIKKRQQNEEKHHLKEVQRIELQHNQVKSEMQTKLAIGMLSKVSKQFSSIRDNQPSGQESESRRFLVPSIKPEVDTYNLGFKIIFVKVKHELIDSQIQRSQWTYRAQLVKDRRDQKDEENKLKNRPQRFICKNDSKRLKEQEEDDILLERKNSLHLAQSCFEDLNSSVKLIDYKIELDQLLQKD